MKNFELSLYEDRIPAGCGPIYLPRRSRAVYVREGDVVIEHPTGCQHQTHDSAWVGQEQIALKVGAEGATLWRWELSDPAQPEAGTLRSAPHAQSILKLAQTIELDTDFEWLLRCDRVEFPPGGIALTHVHQGPGIRCCLKGEITIETCGQSHTHGPGEAWFELGHAPVLAPTTESSETTFIRCFVLPSQCKSQSSIRYVNREDLAKPKLQRYHIYAEQLISI